MSALPPCPKCGHVEEEPWTHDGVYEIEGILEITCGACASSYFVDATATWSFVMACGECLNASYMCLCDDGDDDHDGQYEDGNGSRGGTSQTRRSPARSDR